MRRKKPKKTHRFLLSLFLLLLSPTILFESCEIVDPDAPLYIEASKGKYQHHIYIKWDFVTDASSYNLYYAESKDGYYRLIENTIFRSTEYSPMFDGYYYYFKVSYIDEDGNESDFTKPDYGYTSIPADEYESNDEDYSNTITPGDYSSMRSIHSKSDIDWFKFSAISGTNYTIRTIYPGNNIYNYTKRIGWVHADTTLYIYHDAGGQPASDPIEVDSDTGSPAGYSQIEWSCPASGTYYLKITGNSNNSSPEGWYELSIE